MVLEPEDILYSIDQLSPDKVIEHFDELVRQIQAQPKIGAEEKEFVTNLHEAFRREFLQVTREGQATLQGIQEKAAQLAERVRTERQQAAMSDGSIFAAQAESRTSQDTARSSTVPRDRASQVEANLSPALARELLNHCWRDRRAALEDSASMERSLRGWAMTTSDQSAAAPSSPPSVAPETLPKETSSPVIPTMPTTSTTPAMADENASVSWSDWLDQTTSLLAGDNKKISSEEAAKQWRELLG